MNTEDNSAGSDQSQDIDKVLRLRESLITGKPPGISAQCRHWGNAGAMI